jgi:hypothetical protein
MMIHLLKYSEKSVKEPTKIIYSFVQHNRFIFWMNDRIRRHRTLSQANVFLQKNPEVGAMSMEEIKDLLAAQDHTILKKMSDVKVSMPSDSVIHPKDKPITKNI